MDIRVLPVHETAAEDIRLFLRHLDLWCEGCPLADKRPLFMPKRNRFRRQRELEIIEIAERYGLPTWDELRNGTTQLLDAFDARADYSFGHDDAGAMSHSQSELAAPLALVEAIDAFDLLSKVKGNHVPTVTPELLAQLKSSDNTLIMTARDRFAYFRLELALAQVVPGARFNIGTVLSLLGPISTWGTVCKEKLPAAEHPEGSAAAAKAKGSPPQLKHLRDEIRKALPEELAREILSTQKRWLEARRAWENEMQWAGHFAFKWEPPKGKPKGHGNNDPVTDWGKRMLDLQLKLSALTECPARELAPLVAAACVYLNALHRRTVDPSRFLEPVAFRLDEASPAERKRRAKQRAASQAREAARRASIWEEEEAPTYVDIEDDYHYGPPHEWEIYPNWNGTGNLMYYYDCDIVPPWERDSYPKS